MKRRTIVAPRHSGRHAMPGGGARPRRPELVVVRTASVAALVILGIGGASAATDSGPSSRERPWALMMALGGIVFLVCVAAFIHGASISGGRRRTTLDVGRESLGDARRRDAA